MASYAGGHAIILAVEPEPGNLARLRFNLAANPDLPIRVIALALGDTTGRVVVQLNEKDRGGTTTRPLCEQDDANSVVVECRTLLEVLTQQGLTAIDAMKIDVEGTEDKVLVPFLPKPRRIRGRNSSLLRIRHLWRTDLFALLANKGYTESGRTKLNVMLRR